MDIREEVSQVEWYEDSDDESPEWVEKLGDEFKSALSFKAEFGMIFDHPKFKDGKLVAAPYHIGQNSLRKVIEFCKEHHLELLISGNCEYHRGALRMTVKPRER